MNTIIKACWIIGTLAALACGLAYMIYIFDWCYPFDTFSCDTFLEALDWTAAGLLNGFIAILGIGVLAGIIDER